MGAEIAAGPAQRVRVTEKTIDRARKSAIADGQISDEEQQGIIDLERQADGQYRFGQMWMEKSHVPLWRNAAMVGLALTGAGIGASVGAASGSIFLGTVLTLTGLVGGGVLGEALFTEPWKKKTAEFGASVFARDGEQVAYQRLDLLR